jgi:hypothetical protein
VIAREIGDQRGEAITSWKLGQEYAKQGDLERAIALMQVYIDIERDTGHSDVGAHAAAVEELRELLHELRAATTDEGG